MKVIINSLITGVNNFEFEKTGHELGIKEPELVKVEIKSEVVRTERSIIVKSATISTLSLICDRCLCKFNDLLKDDFTIYYTRDRETALHDEEEVVQVLGAGTSEIDLSSGLRESILLVVPMKAICRKDCKGLCQSCGKNQNEASCHCERTSYDPRWDGLKDLFNRDTVQ